MAGDTRRFTSTGPNTGSNRTPQKKPDNGLWVAVIVLFCVGLWPIALGLMGYIWLAGDKNKQPEDKVRQAQRRMDSTINEALRRVSQAGAEADKAAGQAAQTEPAHQTQTAPAAPGSPRVRQAAPAKKKPRNSGKSIDKQIQKALGGDGSTLRIIGIVLIVLSTFILSEPIDDLIYLGSIYAVEELIVGLNFLVGGGALLGRGLYLRAFARRCRKYVTAIGKSDDMDIDLIARRVGRSYDQAVRDLDKMIDKGVLGDDAYLDLEQGCFLRYGSAGEQRRDHAQKGADSGTSEPPETQEGYSGILRSIRRANDRIADPVLSAKIDRLEQITGQILKEVEEHPEKKARMRTFFEYYLPTTQKLLDAYADFEETGVEGENLRTAKQRIEQTMDRIVEGFAQQLDNLFSADAMDVVSDIKVMETMLQRDTGSAAKDFGYEQYQEKQE